MIDTRLKVFRSVATLLSFTKAANEEKPSSVSLPSASTYKSLKRNMGCRTVSTESAIASSSPVPDNLCLTMPARLSSAYQNLDFDMKKLTEKSGGELRIGASTTISQYVLPELIAEFRKLYPDIRITLLSGNSHEIEDALAAGRMIWVWWKASSGSPPLNTLLS